MNIAGENSAFIAHISEDETRRQTVEEHIFETARLCGEYGKELGIENLCYLCGLLHDIGKLNDDFTGYISGENKFKRGEIDHAYAGAKYLCEFASDKPKIKEAVRLISRVMISHHGLHDWVDKEGSDYFEKRISNDERYEEIKANAQKIIGAQVLEECINKAADEYFCIGKKIAELADKHEKAVRKTALAFYMGMLERLLQSILIDADRCDTAAFMADNSELEIKCDTSELWRSMNEKIENKCADFRKLEDAVSKRRMSISDRCLKFADNEVGACRLIVPTGGGKTLSSLRFAVRYALKNNKKKIIYAAPFMSILEQNSDVIKEFVDKDEYFTENYSNALAKADSAEELDNLELRCERLDSPVIAATFVQFLNSIFSGKTTDVRHFHRLVNSVIIADEVQSMPVNCVYLFDLAVNFLTKICDCTVVLCTATQPSLDDLKYPVFLDENSSMSGNFSEDFKAFKRTEINPVIKDGGYTFDTAADFCMEKYKDNNSLLVVVNTKKAASELYGRISQLNEELPKDSKAEVIHLSTNMCPQHRRDMIAYIKNGISSKKRIICISTQLIEAGVDVSFDCVIRSLSGLDNIAQAAGRCNRNGEREISDVFVINISEESLTKLPEIERRAKIGRAVFDHFKGDLLGNETVSAYFKKFYGEEENSLSYPIKKENTSILELLSTNDLCAGKNRKPFYTNQGFATAGNNFEVIEESGEKREVIVPYNDEANELICKLGSDIPIEDFRLVLRKLQKYMVSTYDYHLLEENKALIYHEKYGLYSLEESFYSDKIGVVYDGLSASHSLCMH